MELKFTPTPNSSINALKADVAKFCRNLKLAEFFNESNDGQQDILDHTEECIIKTREHSIPLWQRPTSGHFHYICAKIPFKPHEKY